MPTHRCGRSCFIVFLLFLCALPALAQLSLMPGRVTMEDGSTPPKPVLIQRYCGVSRVTVEASTNRKGEYVLRPSQFESIGEWGSRRTGSNTTLHCVLRAELPGYESTSIDPDDRALSASTTLPTLVLRKKGSGAAALTSAVEAPRHSQKTWDAAMKALSEGANDKAEPQLRLVVQQSPNFAPGWNALGASLQNQKKYDEAREAYRKGMAADPKSLTSELLLMRLESDAKSWKAAAEMAASIVEKDTAHRHPEALLHLAAAEYQLGHLDKAAASAGEAVRLDTQHRMPKAEYIYGLMLEASKDYPGAASHYRKYLELEPNGAPAQALRFRIENLGKPQQPALPSLEDVSLDVRAVSGMAVPGGMQSLAAAAHIAEATTPADFFASYCRALIRYMQPSERTGIPGYLETMRAYFAAIPALASLGETVDGKIHVTLSLQSASDRTYAEKVLQIFGWRVRTPDNRLLVELGDAAADIPRQRIPRALGIDEIEMRDALESGRTFSFQILSGEAQLMGGAAWLGVIQEKQALAGGLAEAFTRDLRLTKVYAGLSAAGPEGAEALVSALGLRTLAERHADMIWKNGAALAVSQGRVAVPGGAASDAVWTALTGASPKEPAAFYRALFEKEQGQLAAFYFALASAGEGKAAYILASPERARVLAQRFAQNQWNPDQLVLAAGGQFALPGGRTVWLSASAPEESLLDTATAGTLAAVARLDRARTAPMDAATALLFKKHAKDWDALWPLFLRLPDLDAGALAALEQFEKAVRAAPPADRPRMLGSWYSTTELIALAREAGSIDGRRAAAALRQACEHPTDWPAAAPALLRQLSGPGGTLDEAVRARLLRLNGARFDNFDRVFSLQKAPTLEQAARTHDPAAVLTALTTAVYAAWIDSSSLLVSEDSGLSRRHQFLPAPEPIFQPSVLHASNIAPGSNLTGGFAGFDRVSQRLLRGARWDEDQPDAATAAPSMPVLSSAPSASGPREDSSHVFRSDVRLVELYTTVVDSRGHYIDDLNQKVFEVLEEGRPQPITAFETRSSALSAALLLDSTLSMHPTLPALKNAALGLLRQLRDSDQVAVYSFSDDVTVSQTSTQNRPHAARAVARIEARGETAVYDALVKTIRDFASHQGKKVIVMITDGDDNRSTLPAGVAIRKAKAAGIPVYTIALGMALANRALLRDLESISKGTGGLAFAISDAREVSSVFDAISRDLSHGYLLTIHPAAAGSAGWRKLEVTLKGNAGYKVRAREGYQPE
ncbi:MAG: VWA domain-containing protein [Acidobacteria bacterium]|nr:VWA domain-containing protein [Acidobacteriota bacterium]